MGEEKKTSWKDAAEGKAAAETPIQNAYSFSYIKRNSGAKGVGEVESYEKSIKELGDFKTVQGFWRIYNHLMRPNDLPNSMEYHLFKSGIKPMWEDAANRKGGKWMVRVRKGVSSRYWEDLILAIIGEQFDVGNEICGAVVSIRYSEDVISLWNRNADNNEACYRIRDTMRKVLNLPHFVSLEYRRHDTSLSDTNNPRGNNSNQNNSSSNQGGNSSSNNNSGNGEGRNNNSSAWREQRGGGDRSSHREGGAQEGQSHRDSRGRMSRGNSDRGNRGDRSGGGDGNARNAWSRDSKRPIFNRTGSAAEGGENAGSSSSRPGGEAKKSPRSATPNAWQK